MTIDEGLLERAVNNPGDLRFDDACRLATQLGWQEVRRRGSHVVFHHPDAQLIKDRYPRPLNLQEGRNGRAKEYQVKQLLEMASELGIIK